MKQISLAIILIVLLLILLLISPVFAQDSEVIDTTEPQETVESTDAVEPVELPDDDPISILVHEIFQTLMDEDMDAFHGLYHADSVSIPVDAEIQAAKEAFETYNFTAEIKSIKLIGETDGIAQVEVEYYGVLYEEEVPPPFNVEEDEALVVIFLLKKQDDAWKIWDTGSFVTG